SRRGTRRRWPTPSSGSTAIRSCSRRSRPVPAQRRRCTPPRRGRARSSTGAEPSTRPTGCGRSGGIEPGAPPASPGPPRVDTRRRRRTAGILPCSARRAGVSIAAGIMPEPIHFHTDLYRREAVQSAAEKYGRKARIALAESNGHIIAQVEPAARISDAEWCDVRDEFCTEALSLTVMRLRDLGAPETPATAAVHASIDEPPW